MSVDCDIGNIGLFYQGQPTRIHTISPKCWGRSISDITISANKTIASVNRLHGRITRLLLHHLVLPNWFIRVGDWLIGWPGNAQDKSQILFSEHETCFSTRASLGQLCGHSHLFQQQNGSQLRGWHQPIRNLRLPRKYGMAGCWNIPQII